MTDAEWHSCDDPAAMLEALRRRGRGWKQHLLALVGVSQKRRLERKPRLFAAACVRRVWPLLADARSQRAVEAAERFADGQLGAQELALARALAAESPWGPAARAATRAAWAAAWKAAREAAAEAVRAVEWEGGAKAGAAERAAQCALLRDLVGVPGRRVAVDPAWLWWDSGAALRLARSVYDERRFGELPALADALAAAGCADAAILAHCREPAEHARGCWVLDALLGKG
jgi:hypothetical protein